MSNCCQEEYVSVKRLIESGWRVFAGFGSFSLVKKQSAGRCVRFNQQAISESVFERLKTDGDLTKEKQFDDVTIWAGSNCT